jgi:hypothetical protein
MAKRKGEGRAKQNERQASIVKSNKPPRLEAVHAAVFANKINEEEAKDLNPKYDPNKAYGKGKTTQAAAYATFSKGARGFTPSLTDVQRAVDEGHVTHNEARELNPKYRRYHGKVRPLEGFTPKLPDVHEAVEGGHISKGEAIALNPDYKNPTHRARVESAYRDKQAKKTLTVTRITPTQLGN